jgi:hypothetical protein
MKKKKQGVAQVGGGHWPTSQPQRWIWEWPSSHPRESRGWRLANPLGR